jgi:hypothetical protein
MICRVAWRYKDNDNVWQLQGLKIAGVSFGLHVSQLLEDAFQRRELGDILLKLGKHTYSYDQGGTMQTNTEVSGCSKILNIAEIGRKLYSVQNSIAPPTYVTC